MKKETRKTARTADVTRTATENLEFALSDASALADAAISAALEFSMKKMGLDSVEAARAGVQQGDPGVCGYFCHSLARQAAEWLGTWDESIRAVYVCDLAADGADEHFDQLAYPPSISLLIWAERKTGALSSMIEALNRALAQSYSNLVGARPLQHLLDAQVAGDDEVHNRTGYGLLLSALHHKPIRVWER